MLSVAALTLLVCFAHGRTIGDTIEGGTNDVMDESQSININVEPGGGLVNAYGPPCTTCGGQVVPIGQRPLQPMRPQCYPNCGGPGPVVIPGGGPRPVIPGGGPGPVVIPGGGPRPVIPGGGPGPVIPNRNMRPSCYPNCNMPQRQPCYPNCGGGGSVIAISQ
ncbi:unnamed protein product [Soboliphyme baturini]|uniref:Secreted protein n=1 Tax=Soboliphyme baturini TaxID=241478 RepID=A0A183IU58_9BILA|nr:unnamed protein product [Soboliphyme baturini]